MAADWSWLKNRLVSAKTKTNSFWLPSLSNDVIDVGELLKCASNIYDHSINGIISFLNSNDFVEIDLNRLSDISEAESTRRFGTTENLYKLFQNDFMRLYKLIKKQSREFGDTNLFIGLPMIEGINEFSDYYRAPLLYVQVEMEVINRFQKIRLHINKNEYILNPTILGVEVNKRSILFQKKYDTSKLDVVDALNVFKDLNITFKMPLTNEVVPFQKKTKYDLGEVSRGNSRNSVINNVLLGIFDVKGDKLFQDFTTIMNRDAEAIDEILSNKKDLIFNHKEFNDSFNLSQIYLITNIDIYQQLAIKHALMGDVVIEGPPGTGKSETILNIIANIVLNGKTALFVSEKTTAMDVVYNRLGNLKHVALYVPNLTEERKRFYDQLGEYEHYFEKNYDPKLLENPRLHFDSGFVWNAFESSYALHNIYESQVNSGTSVHKFQDILLKFKILDVEQINIVRPEEFDSWLSSCNDKRWISQYNQFLELKAAFCKEWGKENFLKFVQLFDQSHTDREIVCALRNYLKHQEIAIPKVINPFFKPNPKEEKLFQLLKTQVSEYKRLKNFSSDKKADSIIWVIKNNIHEIKNEYFYSWFMQSREHGLTYLKHIFKIQNLLNTFPAQFEANVNQYIEDSKQAIRHLMIRNFYNSYKEEKNQLLELCRQGRSGNAKEISWCFNNYRSLLKKLYPIHIMSFESASILLEVKKNLYDYVIIDEASQVFLERALPVLYRASKYIVAGDTKQLHPSNFFQARANYDEDVIDEITDSSNLIETNEAINATSLIHFLKERARLSTMLRYHYRSDFSNLIAFTSNHIYGNELIFMDKAIRSSRTFIVHNVPEAKWQNNRNFEEANRLINRLIEMSQNEDYDKSVGIITFNKNQADLIESMLDKLNNPKINEWRDRYNENGEYIGLFVKNIENVQGDERDIILFSLGYDKSVNAYGPISKQDGENRLNVAITRSKQRIELFKTNLASEYNGWSSRSPGTRLLVEYLAYCEEQDALERRDQTTAHIVTTEHASENNEVGIKKVIKSIYDQLQEVFGSYFEIRQNIMEGTYFFDFVIYRHGAPVLAINVDLPKFKSMSDFHENFVYKNMFIKKRGWQHYRIWLADWIISPKDVLKKIHALILN